ncbi:cell division protein FtsK [Pandoraea nosoerga]|uniref:Cell division protein FtsK n=2 Tax=Pandoraea nosoerga TaxID=2508296 RepID=A0A5E4STB3_9BURK|nr:DNA translocase FtsK [Pandoraea nosoerga]MBN4666443.1 cell division protein FtsK [Pandoraea nosoerga]MBN4677612.1 cell division protein FtsK [Pandoraea nosoerga]MBN4682534.1 cell division protein FtsK [Pandoraea nosoerga]MBN4745603.1 cell division protein FtsK [Pandoraea nosoerga]VVD78321.1 cell division protein FtsK [Pandoraea nosoerga]
MGFGWFGLSTFWLLALCWPGVRGLLGGEIRLFGPGTLRMLLGVPLTMVSSATLAALTGGEGNTAGGSVGQSLAHGLQLALGGTLAMGLAGVVLLFSLPLVFGTTWWGMFARAKPTADDDDESPYETRFAGSAGEPVRGLSQMSQLSFGGPHERGERGERFTPTLGQGHHNAGHLTEGATPRRRGLAAQPRWKLTDEERARLDAMQPPPLATRGAPRAEPSFMRAGAARVARREPAVGRAAAPAVGAATAAAASPHATAGARAVLPRGAYVLRTARGDTITAPEWVRAEPSLRAQDARGPAARRGASAASSLSSASSASGPRAMPAPTAQRTSSLTAQKPSVAAVGDATQPASGGALHLTSTADGAPGHRRPVGVAPAHLRGTIVHSPFRQPQLGLEDVPPRGASPVATHSSVVAAASRDTLLAADGGMPGVASDGMSSPEAPPIRGAASWSAMDAASPLTSDVAEFSPLDLSPKATPDEPPDAAPSTPTPAMLAEQEAARVAQQARMQALAALREEAEALLRDLREWSSAMEAPVTVVGGSAIAKAADHVAAHAAPPAPAVDETPQLREAAQTESRARAEVLDVPPMVLIAPPPGQPAGAARRPFLFADVLASVQVQEPATVAAATVCAPETAPGRASESDEPAGQASGSTTKPHYVLRADGTWARAEPDAAAYGALPTTAPREAAFTADAPRELPTPREPIAYDLPSLDLLSPATSQDVANVVSDETLAAVGQLIEQRLAEFKVPVTVVGASAGPVITRFEVEPAVGVRGAQVVGLMKDLARALGVTSIRVVETIPGKTCMGLELPNAQRQMIRLSEILTAPAFDSHRSRLALAMGKDITGEPIVADLARAPHLLVAGTTGSGKSVAVNAMILSLLYKATPDDVRLIMIDPKMLELSVYGGIPHLLAPVVTDMKQAAHALNWCVGEMEKRYRLMSALGVRNLAGYNEKIDAARAAGKKIGNPFSLTPDAPEPLDRLPFIVVVIDELADLMMVAGKKIEELIARLAQKARAAGIHLILATQRPSVDVITGLIKANIPTRVAFQVSSKIDSRTILDQMGAESLLGQGDMLFLPPGTGYPQRVHGAFVADDEVHRVVQHWQQYGEPEYDEAILAGDPAEAAPGDLFGESPGDAEADPLYDEAAAFVLGSRRASISAVQRQLRIGYNRAARLIEQMETAGLVSPMGRNGAREVIAPGD